MGFYQQEFSYWSWGQVLEKINKVTATDVETSLARKGRGNVNDFLNLISPVASSYLEDMAIISCALTRKRFGNTIQLFLPIYLSNYCKNVCTYCGFSLNNPVERVVLTEKEALKEIQTIKTMGIDHILLVTGEDSCNAGVDYISDMVSLFKKNFSHVAIEVQPLEKKDYLQLREGGLDAVFLYQETYNEKNYKKYHPRGKKSDFKKRINTMDSLGQAKIHKMGLGVLLGIEDWRVDSFFCALHLQYLKKTYWQTRFSVSFPRLRPATGVNSHDYQLVSARDLAQLIFAYRVWDEDLELSLSTRESEKFRNHIIPLGISSVSAGSKTNPGGYACYIEESLEQFTISDTRNSDEMRIYLKKRGLDLVTKDWSQEFSLSTQKTISFEKT